MFSAINNFFTILKSANDKYITDAKNLTCSCPDWKEKRYQYATNDPRRLCKHLIQKLDENNLVQEVFKYKDNILFYKSKNKGFRDDFNHLIEIPNTGCTLLYKYEFEWMNLFDENGNRYGFMIGGNGRFSWAKETKPASSKTIESFFINNQYLSPIELSIEEKNEIIKLISDKYQVVQENNHIYSSIAVIYDIVDENGDYRDAGSVSVSNEKIDIRLYGSDEAFTLKRDQKIIEQQLEERLINIKSFILESEKYNLLVNSNSKAEYESSEIRNIPYDSAAEEEKVIKKQQEREEDLAIKRKKAIDKGYLLTADYRSEEWPEYQGSTTPKYNILHLYDRSFYLLKQVNEKITVDKFNKTLAGIGILTKCDGLNNSSWILIGDGLNYGINFVQSYSQYTHVSIPEWYIMVDFDDKTSSLQKETRQGFMNMTTILWKKEKFQELLNLVIANLEMRKEKTKKKAETKVNGISTKQAEREEWLQFVECPHCASKNIHKKNKRKYGYGEVQRYQCMDCKKIFQEVLSNE